MTILHVFKMQGLPLTHRGSDSAELDTIISRVMQILNKSLPVEMMYTPRKIAPEKLAVFEKQKKI